jgi:hypothetical protein
MRLYCFDINSNTETFNLFWKILLEKATLFNPHCCGYAAEITLPLSRGCVNSINTYGYPAEVYRPRRELIGGYVNGAVSSNLNFKSISEY